MDEQEQADVRVRMAKLVLEHEDYAHAIAALEAIGTETLRLQRFKKKKLAIKDEIACLNRELTPDIIA